MRADGGKIHPVETQNCVGLANSFDRLRGHADGARRSNVKGMMRREGGADFKVGSDARVQMLCERNARFPGVKIARYATGEDHRALGAM